MEGRSVMAWRLLENWGGRKKEAFGDSRFTPYPDGGDGFTGVKICQIVPFKYVQFIVHHLHLNKAVLKKVINCHFLPDSSHCHLQEGAGNQGMDSLSGCLWPMTSFPASLHTSYGF